MHAHFGNTFADGFTVAEIAERSATQAREDAPFPGRPPALTTTRRTLRIEE